MSIPRESLFQHPARRTGSLFCGQRGPSAGRQPRGVADVSEAESQIRQHGHVRAIAEEPRAGGVLVRRRAGGLERAFRETYGIEMKEIFFNEDLAISTYRHAIGTTIPEMTKVAWGKYRPFASACHVSTSASGITPPAPSSTFPWAVMRVPFVASVTCRHSSRPRSMMPKYGPTVCDGVMRDISGAVASPRGRAGRRPSGSRAPNRAWSGRCRTTTPGAAGRRDRERS